MTLHNVAKKEGKESIYMPLDVPMGFEEPQCHFLCYCMMFEVFQDYSRMFQDGCQYLRVTKNHSAGPMKAPRSHTSRSLRHACVRTRAQSQAPGDATMPPRARMLIKLAR